VPLFIVATPIGNLSDISYRAVTILREAERIYAEDTRVSRRLLDHYIIDTPLSSYHDFNKEKVTPQILRRLHDNEKIAIVSDAGTPGIADPAFYLVRAALREHLPVVPVPGPSAHVAALVASGLPTDRFVFENFLPAKSAGRRRFFASLENEHRTVIFYESPRRIVRVLEELHEECGDVTVAVGREITKMHEEFLRGTPRMLLDHFAKHAPRGEMVVLVNVRVRDVFNQA
jgi:16S rRNA (cytidine1402-2'-O)-methyltransferase